MDCKNCLKLEAELAALRRAVEPIVALLKPKGADASSIQTSKPAAVLEPPKGPDATPNSRRPHLETFERRTLKQVREDIRKEDEAKAKAKIALEKSSYDRVPRKEEPEQETYYCMKCNGFWEAAGLDGGKMCRHKRPKRAATPPGYWNPGWDSPSKRNNTSV